MAAGPNTFNSMPHASMSASAYLKYLSEVFMLQTKKVRDYAGMFMERKPVQDITSYRHTFAGIGSFQVWDGESALNVQAFTPKDFITLTQVSYRNGIGLSWKLLKYLRYREVITEAIAGLGIAGKYDQQTHAFTVLNNGFNTDATCQWYGVTGKALFSATHALANGSTYSNLQTSALSTTTLQQACTKLRKTPDEQGRIMGLQPKYLLVAPDQEFSAHEVVAKGYRMKPGEMSNTPNAINDLTSITIVPCEHITSTTAWYLIADQSFLTLEVSEEVDSKQYPDNTIRGVVHDAIFAQQVGARSWRGLVASTGL